MRILFVLACILFFVVPASSQKKEVVTNFDSVKLDTTVSFKDVFKDAENARIKIDYYHTEGYSTGDRFWYEVVVIDSLVILNFQSPNNDDWDYINYQKQVVVDDSVLNRLLRIIKTSGIRQKKKGIPLPTASGYTADRLFIQTKNINIAGGDVYIGIGDETSDEDFNKRIKKEKEISATIAGNYELVFKELLKLFPQLKTLLKDMDKK